MKVVIDITDWKEEASDLEISTRESIIDALERGVNTGVVARATVVDRELGVAEDDIIAGNKALLNLGAQLEISKVARKATREVVAESGKVYRTRALVGRIAQLKDGTGGGEQRSYIDTTERSATERAIEYLERVVPGHIWPRLLVIHGNGGDVEKAADDLKRRINAQVRKIKYNKEVAT